jgi:EmrB/QacA subfamily drug resistance transporter
VPSRPSVGVNADIVTRIPSQALRGKARGPLLITGRLGDRFGPKRLYLAGLTIFTLASAWSGFAGTMPGGGITMLIVARAVQGFGASLMTPQTMAVITRLFPPARRGQAMGLWGAVAGVATLVGPILGGVLVDGLGWEWIFFVNVPVGIVAFVLASRLVPALPTHAHRFDVLGVVLSALGMFLLVFGIQEGQRYDWGPIFGSITVVEIIAAGVVVLGAFLWWQARNRGEPLLPLSLFRDRNFSLANAAISAVGFTVTCLSLPLVFYFQVVLGFTPTQSALMLVPMAVVTMPLAPLVGRLVDRVNPRYIAFGGLTAMVVALLWYAAWLGPAPDSWPRLLLPSALLGVANAGIWSPITSAATRNLPPRQAGAGSGVFNTTRQVGAVLGSASIAALMQARLTADLPVAPGAGTGIPSELGGALPPALHEGFTQAMAQSLLLPAAMAAVAAVIVVFFARPQQTVAWQHATASAPAAEPAAG